MFEIFILGSTIFMTDIWIRLISSTDIWLVKMLKDSNLMIPAKIAIVQQYKYNVLTAGIGYTLKRKSLVSIYVFS